MAISNKVNQTINGNLITKLATSIAVSSDENASSHDSLWSEVRCLFEAEPTINDDKGARETAARVWKVLESYLVDGHIVARKAYYEADPKKYATQFLKVDSHGHFMAVPSDKGLSFSDEGGYDNYQLGKSYKLSFADCYNMNSSTYSALPTYKEDGTDKHRFGTAGKSLQGFMKANRVKQQEYMTGKKSNVIQGWVKRYKKLCSVTAPTADPKLWEDDLKTECVDALEFFVKAKKSPKHMSEKKREAWDIWFRNCPVSLKTSS
tara:strand:- start:672 stop:1460 length:789 start_codon:yes stop_codon:yes gene_type:complete